MFLLDKRLNPSLVFALLIAILSISGCNNDTITSNYTVRIALFNIWEMSTGKLTDKDSSGAGLNDQLIAASEIIKKINPDVLIINEIDHDIDSYLEGEQLILNARRFIDSYLNQGVNPISYPYSYAAPCNTGFLAGKDFDNNGKIAAEADRGTNDYGVDCYGYGRYPGQYSMAILSRYPLQTEEVRTFQKFLWKDLPDNLIPEEWYSPDELEIFRLSSKSHWDIPVKIGEKTIHILMSHPTPPVFDGPEDRNGRRNYDEIRMWVHYINDDSVMIDDSGLRGGLGSNKSFIIAGDLNADPYGDILETGQNSISQLLNHPRINDCGEILTSEGALMGQEPGPPKYNESRTTGRRGRGRRIDHLLPSIDLNVTGGGVFWPDSTADANGAAMAQIASDHRLIWLDLKLN